MLTEEKIEKYKNQLENDRQEIMKGIEKEEKVEDFGSDVDDFSEETDEAEAMSNHLAIAQTLKNRVNEIDHALNKIQNKTYGACEKCGEVISEKILDIAPESRLCENDKEKK
jgi:DnaK suppressor protein